jgi:hypothetical protein
MVTGKVPARVEVGSDPVNITPHLRRGKHARRKVAVSALGAAKGDGNINPSTHGMQTNTIEYSIIL